MNTTILIIDDDMEMCELLREYLASEGFGIEVVHDGEAGVERAGGYPYGVVILDVMLPRMSGFDVLRRIRETSRIPVLMLTARGEDVDRIVGLEMGADDYLPKPFNPRELVARLRAIQRRTSQATETQEPAAELQAVGDVLLDPGARTVVRGGIHIDLTSVEFSVLEVMMRDSGKVIAREELARKALGRALSYQDRSIDVHVSSIRKKLGPLSDGSERIKSVRGVGYIYVNRSGQTEH